MLALKRLEYILGKPILNTKEFKRLRDEFTKPDDSKPETDATMPSERAESHVEPKTRRTSHNPPTRKVRP
jgi:hypothetical protein